MLNRRSLRIKVMQAVFAWQQGKKANYQVALENIKASFAPDLTAAEPESPAELAIFIEEATQIFEYLFSKAEGDMPAGSERSLKAAQEALAFYNNQIRKDAEFLKNQMVANTELIYKHYLSTLFLLVAWTQTAQKLFDEKKAKLLKGEAATHIETLTYARNLAAANLGSHTALEALAIKKGVDWKAEQGLVRQWYKEVVQQDGAFKEYLAVPEPGFDKDKDILGHLVKNIILKDENIQAYWDDQDPNWTENRAIVRSMVMKTLKSVEEGSQELNIMELSSNWEDDRDFFLELYQSSIDDDERYAKSLTEKLKNWDVNRIALLDKVIIELALTEMVHFASIPINVTINEYIEISKLYSTPKSKQFINGILDVIAEEFVAAGMVRKSGRGLIDNK